MLREDGTSPLLGDSAVDDTCLRFDFARPLFSDLNYWIAHHPGRDGACPVWRRGKPRLYGISTFPAAGYAFLTSDADDGEVHLTFDFGPFSRCRSPNHGHCDALSFELYAHGHPLIVDPGVYLPWNNEIPRSRHFRSTSAHNTLVIDRKEQSELSDYCDVKRTAHVKLLREESNETHATIAAECTPYWAGHEGIRHHREMTLQQRQVTIRDQVSGSGEHLLDWVFQFAPELDIFSNGDCSVSARLPDQENDCLSLSFRADVAPNLNFHRGQTNPLQGWISRNSAEVVPAYAAHYSVKAQLPFEIEFVINLAGPTELQG